MPEPWFAATLDGMTPIGASSPVATSPVTAARSVAAANAGAGAQSPILPERVAGDAGFTFRNQVVQTSESRVELLGAGASNRIRVVKTTPGSGNSTEYRVEYWNGAAWVIIGSVFSLTVSGAWYQFRLSWSGYGTAAGTISYRCFADAGEAPVASGSISGLDFTALSGIVQMRYTDPRGGQPSQFSAAFICDDNGDPSYVYNSVANAEGADTGGTGGFASVNSTGTGYDSTFISLPTAGLRRSIKNTAARNYNARTVRAVSVAARLRRGASGPTSAAVYLTIGGTRYFHPNVQLLTTSFESYTFVWETNPATGLAWDTADAEAAALEWGVEARP